MRAAQIVDDVVARDDTTGCRRIALFERAHRDANGIAHRRAQSHDVEPRRLQCLVVRGANSHRHLPFCGFKSRVSQGTSLRRNERTCILYHIIRLAHAI